MDPNTALANAREATKRLIGLQEADIAPGDDVDHDAALDHAATDLVEAFQALDDWLTGGGFPPDAWRPFVQILVTLPDRSQVGIQGVNLAEGEAGVFLRGSPGDCWSPVLDKAEDDPHTASTYHIGNW